MMVEIQNPTKSHVVAARITFFEREAVERHAERSGLSISQLVRKAVKFYLEAHKDD